MATILPIPIQRFSSRATSSPSKNGEISIFFSSVLNSKSARNRLKVRAVEEKIEEMKTPSSADEITKKYGLEAGLWKIFSSKEGGEKKSKGDEAKELLAKYGGAYLATSITLSLISFGLCYALINAGVDVPALLQKVLVFLNLFVVCLFDLMVVLQVGISADATGEKVGTLALAYAAHKAASPIRFPPTVALTPVVAGWISKKVDGEK
ncbi:uncharacterized protein LOC131011566 isoform X1 [Salvia miltiorrhiza]|uniref:uncharacterized protein LOC131011566 isoform X1 n=1 Tax=Salvia miltiorrhiza TaxID=226208 RepID=UPI0025ABBB3C|nr:uncharacterized protein LOC131011566 isoform X1 [Salvia miltiorrhiza]XP_057795318.1 uncharacterized protein LOC131011566 isoform X1 [Salvia miltiorrhiza]